jgi:hypothetical protein
MIIYVTTYMREGETIVSPEDSTGDVSDEVLASATRWEYDGWADHDKIVAKIWPERNKIFSEDYDWGYRSKWRVSSVPMNSQFEDAEIEE